MGTTLQKKKKGTFSLFTEVLLSPIIVESANEKRIRGRLMTPNAMGWGWVPVALSLRSRTRSANFRRKNKTSADRLIRFKFIELKRI